MIVKLLSQAVTNLSGGNLYSDGPRPAKECSTQRYSTGTNEVSGVIGPLYGSFFKAMARACCDSEQIDAQVFGKMLEAGYVSVVDLGQAKVGDKTLVDTLHPALEAYKIALGDGADFKDALLRMSRAAERGKESTKNLMAKVGRSSRLGDRSKGVIDAGAVSCYLILKSLADTISALL